ncbi:VPLPA-CTERM sorting domain-containing protein [Sneathiella sp.]|uniref:VPLPA-CTERM sorting domain-containing protein n=1 Tax=Sneathiella sp. TaxID=1964365 RepID=UPI00356277A7
MIKSIKITMAAAALSAIMISPAAAIGVNHVTNGGFEDNVGLGGSGWDVFTNIPGWSRTTGRGIEVQSGDIGGSTAYEGNQKIELDSHNLSGTGGASNNSNSGMTQSLVLGPGLYEFSFAYLGRTEDIGTNGIGYSLVNMTDDPDSDILNTDVTGVRSDEWQVFSFRFNLDTLTNIAVNFWAKGTEDTYGGYLDDVRISAVPLPAALPLYGAGLAAMGFMGWRRKRKAAAAAA